MKRYKDLTKDEKEELTIFTALKENWELQYGIILVVAIIPACIGLPLLSTLIPMLILVGGLLVILSIIVIMILLGTIENDKKRLMLIFGKKSVCEGFFGVNKSDLQKVKKKVVYEVEIDEDKKVVKNGKTSRERKRKVTRTDVGTTASK